MNIKTKFSNGNKVHAIFQGRETGKIRCRVCYGCGEIELDGSKYNCPKCLGHCSARKDGPLKWMVGKSQVTIGGIVAIKTANKPQEVSYVQTTVGSSFKERNLFLTLDEAEAECERRNKE